MVLMSLEKKPIAISSFVVCLSLAQSLEAAPRPPLMAT
jgi:hypothetical protein